MATWEQFAQAEPEFAEAVWARFAATKHHVLATLRQDGSPRVSGTEVSLVGPNLTIGSMLNAMKALDLRRDGRFALHANPGDGSMAGGDAKLAGTATEITDPQLKGAALDGMEGDPGPFHLFHLDLTQVVLTSLSPANDYLRIQTWHPGEAIREERR
ncbi:pyridoxamine 5'-phosphate oxidase family protein [Actinocrinis sp.]|uniref:pyridoxamine 5'-phosphate oxidase family protein n=1 Tax=Actinocrinis sp. TaxID=1920516 RepID=UPI002D3277DF|nr:pyridoxamine 5'-phosphate oxidase family protein [Actinocrinis sp.]HZP50871.1 pyridoxamine 5'-phosphate oxidase family protein [Actinocrinis sp.]